MRGFVSSADDGLGEGRLRPWEAVSLDAVGTVIEFWGFKRNQGRLWALLFLRGRAYRASEIQAELGLSKGAVSVLVRELEQWGVVRRVRLPGHRAWHFEAEQDLMAMIRRVLESRELKLVRGVLADLERAETLVRQDPSASRRERERLIRMRRVARGVERALSAFMDTARFDAGGAIKALRRGARTLRESRLGR